MMPNLEKAFFREHMPPQDAAINIVLSRSFAFLIGVGSEFEAKTELIEPRRIGRSRFAEVDAGKVHDWISQVDSIERVERVDLQAGRDALRRFEGLGEREIGLHEARTAVCVATQVSIGTRNGAGKC